MSDHQSPSGSEPTPAHGGSPYVIEHYGFATSHGETGAARPARMRRRKILAAGALGLILAGGVGGVATATAASGPGGHVRGDRGGALFLDGAVDRNGQPAHFDGPGGRR